MGQRVVRFSDLTNKIIEDDAVARIVIEQHPCTVPKVVTRELNSCFVGF
jgi:hypothetical protein